MLSSLAIVINSLEWKFGSRGSSVGIPMPDCRDLLEGSPNARFVTPSRSVSYPYALFLLGSGKKEGWGMVSLGLRDRGPGGKERATELRTGH